MCHLKICKKSGVTAKLGTGTLSVEIGGKSMDVTIDSTNNTLSGIANAINKAGNNPGVTSDGIGAQLNKGITNFVKTGGIIDSRNTALNADLHSITAQQTNLANYSAALKKQNQNQNQFTALNTLMATMNNNALYLTALFGGSKSSGALATNK